MTKTQVNNCDDASDASSMSDYAPKKYSVREHAVMVLKIFLIVGVIFGFLWGVSLFKAQ